MARSGAVRGTRLWIVLAVVVVPVWAAKGPEWAAGIGVALVLLESMMWPKAPCRACSELGSGKRRSPVTHPNFRDCTACAGTGKNFRLIPRLVYRRPR